MSESQNPVQGFFGNLKDKAQNLAENVGNMVEDAADKVLGEERVDQIKDVLNKDVKEIGKDIQATVQDKTEDLKEGAQNLAGNVGNMVEGAADKVLGEERVDQIKDVLNKDVREVASDVKEKVEDVLKPKTDA